MPDRTIVGTDHESAHHPILRRLTVPRRRSFDVREDGFEGQLLICHGRLRQNDQACVQLGTYRQAPKVRFVVGCEDPIFGTDDFEEGGIGARSIPRARLLVASGPRAWATPSSVGVTRASAHTFTPSLAAALGDRPHRLLALGVPPVELRRCGTGRQHRAAHGLDAAGIRRSLDRLLSGVARAG